MKKRIIIPVFVILIISLSSFAFNNWNGNAFKPETNSNKSKASVSKNFLETINKTTVNDLVYDIDSRFIHTVTLEYIRSAKTIADIIPKEASEKLSQYGKNKLGLLQNQSEITLIGNGKNFNLEQTELLSQLDYGADLYINADCKTANPNGDLDYYGLVYYMSIVPHKEAEYAFGNQVFIDEIKKKTRTKISHLKKGEIKPCRIRFSINKVGKLTKADLESTSGYEDADLAVLQAIKSTYGKWVPAENAKGEKVDQELVFFFGISGC